MLIKEACSPDNKCWLLLLPLHYNITKGELSDLSFIIWASLSIVYSCLNMTCSTISELIAPIELVTYEQKSKPWLSITEIPWRERCEKRENILIICWTTKNHKVKVRAMTETEHSFSSGRPRLLVRDKSQICHWCWRPSRVAFSLDDQLSLGPSANFILSALSAKHCRSSRFMFLRHVWNFVNVLVCFGSGFRDQYNWMSSEWQRKFIDCSFRYLHTDTCRTPWLWGRYRNHH